MPKNLLRLLTLGFAAAATVSVFTKTQELTSAWRQVDLEIDGNDAEWPGGAALMVDAPIAVGVSNDSEFLYVRIRTSDRGTGTQLLFGGLTVWFDSTGGTRKSFGVKYPIGTAPPESGRGERGVDRQRGSGGGMPPPPDTAGAEGGRGQGQGRGGPQVDPGKVVPARLELLGAKKEDLKAFSLDEAPAGIRAGISRVENTLVLELRVPLARSSEGPYGIGVDPGAIIGLGFETGKIERPKMSGGPGGGGMGGPGGGGMGGPGGGGMGGPGGGGMGGPGGGGMGGPGGGMGGPGGGMGGPGGGMGGPGGGPGGRPGDEMSKTLRAWARVRLATAE